MTKKICAKCNKLKRVDEFYNHPKTKDGKSSYCKACAYEAHRAWKAKHYGEYLAYLEQWQAANRDKIRAYNKEAAAGLPEVVKRAHYLVAKAVRKGELDKPDRCSCCGKLTHPRVLIGHHEDYSKPLEVEWLCMSCHNPKHGRRPFGG